MVAAVALMGGLARAAVAADVSTAAVGLWTSQQDGSTVELRRTPDGTVNGVLVGVPPAAAIRGYAYDQTVIRNWTSTGTAIRFELAVRTDDPEQAQACPAVFSPFEGLPRGQTVRGTYRAVRFSPYGGECRGFPTAEPAPFVLASSTAPACCGRLDFGCDELDPAGHGIDPRSPTRESELRVLRADCEDSQRESLDRCRSRLPFRGTFAECREWQDRGESLLPILIISVSGRPALAVSGERRGGEWRFVLSARQERDERGHSFFSFERRGERDDPAPLDAAAADALFPFSAGDELVRTTVRRIHLTREEAVRAWLERSFLAMAEQCLSERTLDAHDPVALAVFSGYLENIAPPEVMETVNNARIAANVLADPRAGGGTKAMAGLALAGVAISVILDGPGMRGVLLKLARRVSDKLRFVRARIQGLEEMLEVTSDPARRRELQAELERMRAYERKLRETAEGVEQAQNHVGDQGDQAFRELVLRDTSDQDVLAMLRRASPGTPEYNGVAEVLGMRAVRRFYPDEAPPGFARPFRPQRHGPDAGVDEAVARELDEIDLEAPIPPAMCRREGGTDVLVEAKARRGATAATRPEDVLSTMDLPGHPLQNSPEHVRSFARGAINSARREIRAVQRLLDQGRDMPSSRREGWTRRQRELQEHIDYWQSISDRVASGNGVRREVIITNTATGEFFRWVWEHGSYVLRGQGRL